MKKHRPTPMDVEHRATIELPHDLGEVAIEVGDEHHQGAHHVQIRLPFAVDGRTLFRTTGGWAWLSTDRGQLFLHDACVILRVELADRTVSHLLPPPGEYFADVEETATSFRCRLYGENPGFRWVELDKASTPFAPGTGPVVEGRFPSAFP